ncbi:MAG: FecR domain-containing protein [Asticcacaulis sp.]
MAVTEAPKSETLTEQAEHWVVRLASGEITAEELLRFENWLAETPAHRNAFDQARILWQSLEAGRHQRRVQRRAIIPLAVAGLAACLVVGLVAPELSVQVRATDMAPTGSVKHLTLSDGSQISLDTGAAVAVRFTDTERRIELLRGRGWFEVAHADDRPFRVTTGKGITEDIGTAFEVAHLGAVKEVAVTEGVVQVFTPATPEGVRLEQTQRARYQSDGKVERLGDLPESTIAAWRRGVIVVEEQPVKQAIDMVGRYRKGLILVQADTSQLPPVSGVFRTDAPDEALDVLARTSGLHVERWPGNIVLVTKNHKTGQK